MTDWVAYTKAHPWWTFYMASAAWFDFGCIAGILILGLIRLLRGSY